MASVGREFQAGLDTKAIREKRQTDALTARREQRESSLELKRAAILEQKTQKSSSIDPDPVTKLFASCALANEPKIIEQISEFAADLPSGKQIKTDAAAPVREEKTPEEEEEDNDKENDKENVNVHDKKNRAENDKEDPNEKINEYLDKLFKVGVVRRDKSINLFQKILSKIIENPNEEKYQNLNLAKITNKFTKFSCPFMVELLWFAGFYVAGDRMRMGEDNKSESVLAKLTDKIKENEDKLKREKLKVIADNKARLNGKVDKKKQAMKSKILQQHKEQMSLAKKGIYNVKACVSDRKGSGCDVNTLGV